MRISAFIYFTVLSFHDKDNFSVVDGYKLKMIERSISDFTNYKRDVIMSLISKNISFLNYILLTLFSLIQFTHLDFC